ncbi:MAG: hypothetical protein RR312_08640 [Bacteroidales bacterium]
MITTTDTANILVLDCKIFGLAVHQKGNIPKGEVKTERIIVLGDEQKRGPIWITEPVEVHFCVPDIDGNANLIRLNELGRQAMSLEKCGMFDGTAYSYSVSSIGIGEDSPLKCHYVNLKLLFKIINVL